MDFVQKWNFFLSAFFTEIISEKIVLRYCGKKRMIIRGKKLNFKTEQKWTFPKGLVHRCCPKIEFSLTAFFHRNYVRGDRFWIF